MSQTFFCHCLNVTIRGDLAGRQQVNDSIPGELQSESFKAATLLAVKADDIKVNHNYLSLKRNISNWQINFCAVCEKETHAVLLGGDDSSGLVLVSSHCSNNIQEMDMIMADPAYSAIFGIRIAQKESYRIPGEMGKIFSGELMVESAMSEVEMEASAKVKQSLYIEQIKMDERIKEYIRKENGKYEELCKSAQKEKNDFMKMVEAINRSPEMIDYSFDKESTSELKVETISYSHEKKEDFFLGEEASMFEISSESFSKQTGSSKEGLSFSKRELRSADFDGLFDMDDIEGDGKGSHLKGGNLFDDDEDTAQKEEDAFLSSMKDSEDYDQVLPLAESGNNIMSKDGGVRTRKMASSVSQNVPLVFPSRLGGNPDLYGNSLPIMIPRHMSALTEDHEDNITNPNDSIADRIQKLARSVRNNVPEFLDDRPRRRLNTGDLVKSRNYSQNL